ncbi:MAG: ATP synthase F1 subunit gamma [Candidatus Melainabacteria bacterium]|nr:ATP synthase F1 subunit gamma [Candidatus Melainabacteria bacterium]
MPNLKDIRRRIKSVKNTQKITQAMRMVAAAKVKRAETRMKAARPYAQALQQMFSQVHQGLKADPDALTDTPYESLFQPRSVKRVALVILSSDRGLCGAYNTNIIRQALRREAELLAQGVEPRLYLVGNKITQAVKRYGKTRPLDHLTGMTAEPGVHHARLIADSLIAAYRAGEIDEIRVLSTRFRSMISYQIQEEVLLPISQENLVQAQSSTEFQSGQAVSSSLHSPQVPSTQSETLLEPSLASVVEALVPLYLSRSLYRLLLEATASELAARMTAMSNATNNAADMIGSLTVVYNKARQTAITQEILEVVSGAQALG